jgi:uncharacterized membrane protein YccF (DUF307 family)
MLDALLEAVRDMTLAMLWLGTQVVAAGIGSMLTVAGIGTALRRRPVAAASVGPAGVGAETVDARGVSGGGSVP